jgi:predicted CxxxxCH...CXXCH cytochrome family protein
MSGMSGLQRVALLVLMVLVGVASLVSNADAAVSFDNGDTTLTMVGSQAGTTPSGTIAKGTGSNRLLVVLITVGNSAAVSGDLSGSTVQYGGQDLTPIASTFGQRSAIWAGYLKEAEIAAASNTTITTNLSTSNVGIAKIFAGVFQDALSGPADNPIFNYATGNKDFYDAAAAVISTPSNSITIPADGFGVVGAAQNGTGSLTWSSPATYEGAPNEVENTTTNTHSASSHAGGASDTVETNITVTPSASGRIMMVAFSIAPGSTCAATAPSDLAGSDAAGAPVEVNLSWTADCAGNNTYTVYRDGSPLVAGTDLACSAGTMNFTDAFVVPSTSYAYTVRGTNSAGACESADSNTVNVTTNACSEATPSIVWTAQNSAAGDFSGSPFVTLTNINSGSMEYQVTEGSGAPPAFSTYTENFATGDNFGSWTASDTDATAGVSWLTLDTQTPSGTNTVGPTVDQSGSGFYAYTESTGGTYPSEFYLESPSIDNVTYAASLDFYWNKNHNGSTYCELYVDASSDNGATWDNMAIWNPTPPTVESVDGATWTRQAIDLSGIAPTGAQNNIKVRFRTVSGGWQCDTGLDTITIDGTARSTETTVIPWTADPIPGMANLTNGNTYNLYARGLSSTCGVSVYGDSVSQLVPDGTPTTFDWSACTETRTLTLQPITDPITGDVTVTATGTATGISVGTTPATGNASGWVYSPAQDDNTTTVSFYATGTGTCGPLTDSQLNVATNTLAAPIITGFVADDTIDTVAPLDITISTFSATDNVGVTGYVITESAVAPGAGDAGWLASAPTTYTVGSYNTYTLYAWTKDAEGNVSSSLSSTATISNCVEAGTVSVSISPDPGAGDITGATTVSAVLGGGASNGMVRWSVDGGPWNVWVTSGSIFTPPNVRTGSVGFEAMADGSCGAGSPVYSSGIVRTYETRVDALEPVTFTAAQNGLTGIRVHMGYHNDKNSTGTFLVEYKLTSEPTTWTTPSNMPTTDGGAGDTDGTRDEEVFVDLPGLTGGETYDVRMTFADASDGLIGAAEYIVQVTLVSWADNPMLHNSNRFTGTTKHTGNWGKPGDYAGPIQCSTCHGKNTGNVKRVKADINFPDGSTMPGGGISAAVSLLTVEDGTSDFGDDSAAPRASSSRVCEVCHTYDASQTVGVKQHAANQSVVAGHYDNSDCIKCHQHSAGFKADCTTCHANPPLVAGDLTATLNPVNSTGSATAGKHDYHVITKGYTCNTCHTGWEASGEMPKNGNLNLGFDIVLGTTTDSTGTYDGRSTGGGYNAAAGTTVTTGNGLSCSAIYCHGTATPAWTDAGTAACGSCHGDTNGMPSAVAGDGDLSGANSGSQVGKHPEHVVNAGLACSTCHKDLGFGTPDHVNGQVDIWFDTAVAGASATYNNATNTCSNLSCHISKVWDTATPASCDMCHGYPPLTDGSANDLHVAGATPVDHSGANMTTKHDECNLCHGYSQANGATDNTGNGGDLYQVSYHRDGNIEMNGISAPDNAQSAEYDQSTFGCAKACHANDAAHQLSNSGLTVMTHEYGSGSCTGCHDGTGSGATLVSDTSPHALASTGLQCEECHGSHGGGTIEIPNNPAVGINYTANGETGIALGVAGTAPGATEAEICWNCHGATYSEFGVNNKSNTGNMAYNYGTLNQTNWVGATWTSGTAKFGYKTGTIQSTHSVNPAATGPGMDAVGTIRCSYCHDVHDVNAATGDTLSGAPYLRGTWMGNPYREDGAPRATDTYANLDRFGAVPRGSTAHTELGGFQIDQNNGNPTTGWTLASSAGLCTLCHGTDVNNMNQFGTASTDWVGTNGHSNAVIGGTGSNSANIFSNNDRNTSAIINDRDGAGNPTMAYMHASGDRGFGFRSTAGDPDGWNLNPRMNFTERPYGFNYYNWGATVDANTTDNGYHKFSCSKCHNPHASRLPRLMITNCLDTNHNTWDTKTGVNTLPNAGTTNNDGSSSISSENGNVAFSNSTSAQNCHRVADPNYNNANGAGWNNVTPWQEF